MNLFVSNLHFTEVAETELRDLFEGFGEVRSVSLIRDRKTDRSRGFGFVEMATEEDAALAIQELNGTDFHGRCLRVQESKPKGPGA